MASRMVCWSWLAPACCRRPSEPQPQEQELFDKTRPLDPPPRAARFGAASGVVGPTAVLGEERSADTSECAFDVAHDQRRFESKHAIPSAFEQWSTCFRRYHCGNGSSRCRIRFVAAGPSTLTSPRSKARVRSPYSRPPTRRSPSSRSQRRQSHDREYPGKNGVIHVVDTVLGAGVNGRLQPCASVHARAALPRSFLVGVWFSIWHEARNESVRCVENGTG